MERGSNGEEEGEKEEGGESLEQLRFVFNLCDTDRDGVISVEEFRRIGLDHFDRTKPMEVLIQQIDPEKSGRVTFSMFRAGIETFRTSCIGRSRSTSQDSSSIDCPSSPNELSSVSEDMLFASDSAVHPLFASSHSIIPNGYHHNGSSPGCDLFSLSGDGEDDTGTPLHSSPLPLRRQSVPATARDNPSLVGRLRPMLLHSQLALPGSPAGSNHSKCSTPAEAEAEEIVCQLSDQLQDLSSKLENLEEDQRTSRGARERLRREKEGLHERVEEYEEQIRSTEQVSQRMLQKPGSELRFKGAIVLAGEAPLLCFAATFVKGHTRSIDYFTCKDCSFNWVCQPCAQVCHKGHVLVTYLRNHKPSWACCYCPKKKKCCIQE